MLCHRKKMLSSSSVVSDLWFPLTKRAISHKWVLVGFLFILVNTIPPLWLIVCLSSRLVFCFFIRHSSLHSSYTFQRIFLVSRSKLLSVCNVFFSCSFLRAVLNDDIIHNSTSPSLVDFAVFFRDWRRSHQMWTGNVFRSLCFIIHINLVIS